MSLRIGLLLVLILALGVTESKDDHTVKCQKNVMKQLNDYITEIELVPNGRRRFPMSIADLKEACRINKKIVGLLTQMANKCMAGFTKNVMQVTLYSIRKSQKSLCKAKPNKEMRDFVAAGQCVNAGRQQFRQCLRDTQKNLLATKDVPDKQKIPIICCEIVRAKQCLMHEAHKVKECKDSHIETIQSRFSHVSSNSINIACGDYNEDTDRCRAVHPPPNPPPVPTNQTFVVTMFQLMESFDQDGFAAPPSH